MLYTNNVENNENELGLCHFSGTINCRRSKHSGGIMRKIKTIAMRTMDLGFLEDAEKILYNLMEAQIREMGLLHEETLDTIVLLAHNLAASQKWDQLGQLYDLLAVLDQPQRKMYPNLRKTILSLRSLQREVC